MRLVLLVMAINFTKMAMALPTQTILVEPSFPLAYNLNVSWTHACPGGKTQCANSETCCLLQDEGYGCCPFKDGVCCSDRQSCCPHHTKCNVAEGTCEYYGESLTSEKVVKSNMNSNQCPEDESCSSGETCCVTNAGDLGCCPYENAVCCDSNYCCPGGMKCDLKEMRCAFKTHVDEEVFSYPISVIENVRIKCSNPDFSCQQGMTCCKLFDGDYGCCPYENAQCCADGKHCCPQGYKCDVQDGRCLPAAQELAELVKPVSKTCPDPKVTCPQGTTCCPLQSGSYGCCPYADGVCCKDGAHCCPSGTRCDLKHGRCQLPSAEDGRRFLFLFHSQVIDYKLEKVSSGMSLSSSEWSKRQTCPNPEDFCLDGQTCCQISETDYGCCPFSNAVCCGDMLHCCPQNTKCDLKSDACVPKEATNSTISTLLLFP